MFFTGEPTNEPKETVLRQLMDIAIDAIVIFSIVFLVVRPFILSPFQVRQHSMEPTLSDREYIVVAKLPYLKGIGWREYERGDVVVFTPEKQNHFLVKRILAIGGDTVKITGGVVYLKKEKETDFQLLTEPYLSTKNHGSTCVSSSCSSSEKEKEWVFTVPANEFFVVGDNRLNSRDSRTCFSGSCEVGADRFISHPEIEGVARIVLFPFSDIRGI